jgi:hypothetical protein
MIRKYITNMIRKYITGALDTIYICIYIYIHIYIYILCVCVCIVCVYSVCIMYILIYMYMYTYNIRKCIHTIYVLLVLVVQFLTFEFSTSPRLPGSAESASTSRRRTSTSSCPSARLLGQWALLWSVSTSAPRAKRSSRRCVCVYICVCVYTYIISVYVLVCVCVCVCVSVCVSVYVCVSIHVYAYTRARAHTHTHTHTSGRGAHSQRRDNAQVHPIVQASHDVCAEQVPPRQLHQGAGAHRH